VRVDVHSLGAPPADGSADLEALAARVLSGARAGGSGRGGGSESSSEAGGAGDAAAAGAAQQQQAEQVGPPQEQQAQEPEPPPPRRQLLCTVRALLKKVRQRVLVGDVVSLSGVDWGEGRGVVEGVLPRRSELVDPAVANVDHVVLLFGLTQPPVSAGRRAARGAPCFCLWHQQARQARVPTPRASDPAPRLLASLPLSPFHPGAPV
jgi:hypothetical protein